jgi:hypothetical protein
MDTRARYPAERSEPVTPRRYTPGTCADPFCILIWRFSTDEHRIDDLAALLDDSAALAREQPKCLFQRQTRAGLEVQVHAGFEDAFGALTHVIEFSETLKKAATSARLDGLEIHGTGTELALLRTPLRPFGPVYFERHLGAAV